MIEGLFRKPRRDDENENDQHGGSAEFGGVIGGGEHVGHGDARLNVNVEAEAGVGSLGFGMGIHCEFRLSEIERRWMAALLSFHN